MKITDVQAIPLRIPQKMKFEKPKAGFNTESDGHVLVKVFTDEGITGIGEAWRLTPGAVAQKIHRLKASLATTLISGGVALVLALVLALRIQRAMTRPLVDLTRAMAAANISIVSAVIATYGAQVVDTFYVKDMFGLKLHQKSKQDALERRLRQAILDGAERAKA